MLPDADHDDGAGVSDFYDLAAAAIRKGLADGLELVVVDLPGSNVLASDANGLDTIDAVIDALRAEDAEMRAQARADQNAVTWGDHFVRYYDDLTIYGEIPTLHWWQVNEPEDFRRWDQPGSTYSAGYRFARHYSTTTPAGEPGYTHVASMTPIDADEFDYARARGWRR